MSAYYLFSMVAVLSQVPSALYSGLVYLLISVIVELLLYLWWYHNAVNVKAIFTGVSSTLLPFYNLTLNTHYRFCSSLLYQKNCTNELTFGIVEQVLILRWPCWKVVLLQNTKVFKIHLKFYSISYLFTYE